MFSKLNVFAEAFDLYLQIATNWTNEPISNMQAGLQDKLLEKIFVLVLQVFINSAFVEVKESHADLKISPQGQLDHLLCFNGFP